MNMSSKQLSNEFDRQVEMLIEKGYPTLASISPDALMTHIKVLREKVAELALPEADLEKGFLPFVIVVKSDLVAAEEMMALTMKRSSGGVTVLRPHTSTDFETIEDVQIPSGPAYLLVGVDRGKESINLPPNEAIGLIRRANRTPLTIDEGIAIVTHVPDFLMKNNCFSLLASRTGTDKRVPAIWINARK